IELYGPHWPYSIRRASPPASAAVSSAHVAASAGSPSVHTIEMGGAYGRIGCAPSTVSITTTVRSEPPAEANSNARMIAHTNTVRIFSLPALDRPRACSNPRVGDADMVHEVPVAKVTTCHHVIAREASKSGLVKRHVEQTPDRGGSVPVRTV